jgi:thiol:disulfide interchange protein DsbG
MNTLSLTTAVLATALLAVGCGDAPSGGTPSASSSQPLAVSVQAVASGTKGFSVGSAMSARTVYVFFDPQCPHCNELWEAAKPLKSQARFVWIPVGLLNPSSTAQGATLLAAADPVAAMDEHEASMRKRAGGIGAGSNLDAHKESVAANTAVLTRFGFTSIPTIVATHAQTGALVAKEGALPTAALASLLGLQSPATAQ